MAQFITLANFFEMTLFLLKSWWFPVPAADCDALCCPCFELEANAYCSVTHLLKTLSWLMGTTIILNSGNVFLSWQHVHTSYDVELPLQKICTTLIFEESNSNPSYVHMTHYFLYARLPITCPIGTAWPSKLWIQRRPDACRFLPFWPKQRLKLHPIPAHPWIGGDWLLWGFTR